MVKHIDERCVHGGYWIKTEGTTIYRSEQKIEGYKYIETWNEHLNKRWSQFLASYIFLRLLFSRVVGGQTYKMALEEIKSRQPITINQG
jgi:hypothetical protein